MYKNKDRSVYVGIGSIQNIMQLFWEIFWEAYMKMEFRNLCPASGLVFPGMQKDIKS